MTRDNNLTPSGQEAGMNDSDAIRIASTNLLDGGLSQDGTATRREQPAAALRDWQPHLVLVQELYAPGEELVRRHFRALATATGMEPAALGLPRGSSSPAWHAGLPPVLDARQCRTRG